MSDYRVVIKCDNCMHKNKQEMGMPGFELLTSEFESLSEAHEHMMNNPHHYVYITIHENSEQDD